MGGKGPGDNMQGMKTTGKFSFPVYVGKVKITNLQDLKFFVAVGGKIVGGILNEAGNFEGWFHCVVSGANRDYVLSLFTLQRRDFVEAASTLEVHYGGGEDETVLG